MTNPRHDIRDVRAARGTELTAKSWMTEAPLRMLMNNLDPEVAENPHELVVYGGIGRAARTWADFDKIVDTLRDLNEDETLMVQSGKPETGVHAIQMELAQSTHLTTESPPFAYDEAKAVKLRIHLKDILTRIESSALTLAHIKRGTK